MGKCTSCGAKTSILMSLCDTCIEKGRIAARGSAASSTAPEPPDTRGESKRLLFALSALALPIAAQVFWGSVLSSDTFMLGLPFSVALGAAFVWRIPQSPRARVMAVLIYVLVYGPLLFIGTLGWHISTHGF